MAFDYKKEYKEFYMPKNKPSIVEIPKIVVEEINSINGLQRFFETQFIFLIVFKERI